MNYKSIMNYKSRKSECQLVISWMHMIPYKNCIIRCLNSCLAFLRNEYYLSCRVTVLLSTDIYDWICENPSCSFAQELKSILLLIVIATLVHYPDTIAKLV